eukprot:259552-Rhodomonas_salina.4
MSGTGIAYAAPGYEEVLKSCMLLLGTKQCTLLPGPSYPEALKNTARWQLDQWYCDEQAQYCDWQHSTEVDKSSTGTGKHSTEMGSASTETGRWRYYQGPYNYDICKLPLYEPVARALSSYAIAMRCPVQCKAIVLRDCYAVSSTEPGHAATSQYAISGTDLGYAATRPSRT